MNIKNDVQCSIHNKFDIEVIDGKTGKIKQTAKAYNMVLDNLWHYIIETTTAFGTNIQYGSGTGTIQSSDTSLFNRVNGKGVTQDELTCDYLNKIITRRVHINLPLTEAIGVTITEVGLAAGTGNGSLTTHAILQDMNGNPISILKTEFDIINIYAMIYCHWNTTLNNINSEVIFYPGSGLQNTLTGASNVLGSFTGGFSRWPFYAEASKTWSKSSSNLANKTITYTVPRYSQSEGNISGGSNWLLGTSNFSGIGLKQGIKTWNSFQITNETLGTGDGVITGFKTKWDAPYNATVYVNGIAQVSGVSILQSFITKKVILISNKSTESNIIKASMDYFVPMSDNTYPVYLYNLDNLNVNIAQFYVVNSGSGSTSLTMTVYGSNDLVNWETVLNASLSWGNSTWSAYVNVPQDKQNMKYYKFYANDAWGRGSRRYQVANILTTSSNNIIFDTPPAVGDVITIDYDTDCIPKDEDHVLDASITFKFGDYVPTP